MFVNFSKCYSLTLVFEACEIIDPLISSSVICTPTDFYSASFAIIPLARTQTEQLDLIVSHLRFILLFSHLTPTNKDGKYSLN